MSTNAGAPGQDGPVGLIKRLMGIGDIGIGVALVVIVTMMIIPMPTIVLDVLITLNISLALAIALSTLYTTEPLQFSVFPSLLLLATLFRLALNIAATRLILLNGDAGSVVHAFGEFVIGGSVIVGLIVFLIIVIIQFVVITNGAGRVAEVAARFTLDALPGKQLAIDADLNAGAITDEEARARREAISKEADFYGAMDGASKFVKGDAIAGILIVAINLVGGLTIGIVIEGMGFAEAAQHYSLLSIGEGLVAQIPALLISTATGIIVTRAASDANMGSDLFNQLFTRPRVMYFTGGVILALALVPGMPKIPFFLIGGMIVGLGYAIGQSQNRDVEAKAQAEIDAQTAAPREPENVSALLPLDPLELEIGYGLIPLVDENEGGDLLGRVAMVRRQMATELGLSLAPIRIRDNIQLASHEYAIKIRGVQVAQSHLQPGQLLAMNPGTVDTPIDGLPTTEPAFGLPAVWISEAQREQAEIAGYTVVDAASLIVTHLSETIRTHVADLLSRQDVRVLLDTIKERTPAPVDELVPDLMSVGEIQRVLQALLKEGVPIRDMVTILETLGDKAKITKDTAVLAEYCRQALQRTICGRYVDGEGVLRALTLDPDIDREIAESVTRSDDGTSVAMDPQRLNDILMSIREAVEQVQAVGLPPVLLCSGATRRHLKALSMHVTPQLVILSYQEIPANVQIEPLGIVQVTAPDVAGMAPDVDTAA